MVRTVISLDPDDKAWLDQQARKRGQSMTSVVRDAVARLRAEDVAQNGPSLDTLLDRTNGIWKRGDGLAWQRKMRADWHKR